MGWYIHTIENTIVIPEADRQRVNDALVHAGRHEVFTEASYGYASSKQAIDFKTGKLIFYRQHKEWADYMWRKEIQRVLKKEKVNGIVKWGCNSGDDEDRIWWYEFVNGKCTEGSRNKRTFKIWFK